MDQFKAEGHITVSPQNLEKVQASFAAHGVIGEECLDTISRYYREHDYLLDPHTACGIAAYEACNDVDEVCVTLSTAHPAKFNESIQRCEIEQTYPAQIQQLFNKPQYQEVVDGDQDEIAKKLTHFFR